MHNILHTIQKRMNTFLVSLSEMLLKLTKYYIEWGQVCLANVKKGSRGKYFIFIK